MSVERIERKGGAVWRVRWRDAQGRERSKVIGRKRDAEVFEAEVVRRKRTGDLDLLTGGRETLAEFAEEWWKLYAVPNLASRTLQSYAKCGIGMFGHGLAQCGSTQSRPKSWSAIGRNWKRTAWGCRPCTGRLSSFKGPAVRR